MTASAFATALLVFCLLTTTSVRAQSAPLLQEVEAVNRQVGQKAYAKAIPHAQHAISLARNDSSVSAAQRIELLNVLAQLYYLTGNYPSAERTTREVLNLRKNGGDVHAVAVSEEDLAELLDLQGKFAEADPLHASATAGLETIVRGGPSASSALGTHVAWPIRARAFDFYDPKEPEERGYGRYTYVILSSKKDRGTALLSTLFEAPPGSAVAARNRAIVNAFEIPVSPAHRAEARKRSAPATDGTLAAKAEHVWSLYDFSAANNMLLTACQSKDFAPTKACQDIGGGPYLLAFRRPASAFPTLPQPYLVVDMSNMRSAAFPYIVKTMQRQLEAKDLVDIKDAGGIHSMQTWLLETVLVANDWLTPISESVAQWMKVVPQK